MPGREKSRRQEASAGVCDCSTQAVLQSYKVGAEQLGEVTGVETNLVLPSR